MVGHRRWRRRRKIRGERSRCRRTVRPFVEKSPPSIAWKFTHPWILWMIKTSTPERPPPVVGPDGVSNLQFRPGRFVYFQYFDPAFPPPEGAPHFSSHLLLLFFWKVFIEGNLIRGGGRFIKTSFWSPKKDQKIWKLFLSERRVTSRKRETKL